MRVPGDSDPQSEDTNSTIVDRAGLGRSKLRRLHGEDDAELGFAAGHAVVGFVDFFEREFFDHGLDAGVGGEAQGVFGVGRGT